MKVAILSWNPYFDPSGTASTQLSGFSVGFVDPLVRHLLDAGHGVALITPDPGGEAHQGFPRKPEGLVHRNLRGVSIPKVAFANGSLLVEAALMDIRRRLGGLDVVLVVYVFPHIVAVDRLRSRLGYRVFSFLRGSDMFPGCRADSPYAEAFGEVWPQVHRLVVDAINGSERVYCVSQMMAEEARAEGIRVDGLAPTPPIQSPDVDLSGSRGELRSRFLRAVALDPRPDPDRHWVVYLGRLHREKRVDLLIEAGRGVADAEVLVAGTGEDAQRLRELGGASLGFVPPRYVPLLCRCTDVAVHPTTPDFFVDARPSSCTNFVHHGIPIVFAYDENRPCSGLGEIVSRENFAELRVDASQGRRELIAGLRDRVRRVLEDRDLRSRISAANAAFAARQRLDRVFVEVEAAIRDSAQRSSRAPSRATDEPAGSESLRPAPR